MTDSYRPAQRMGLIAGVLAFFTMLLLPSPAALSPDAWRTAAVAVTMAIWWMTEAIPIPATALVPLAFFPLLGVLPMADAAAPYANELIFLFMGGFFLAVAMEKSGLHRRIALVIMVRVGSSPRRLVLGFMLATAFLSMWISNTATTAMMLPIAIAVGEMLRPRPRSGEPAGHMGTFNFGIALMLGVAYAASIGGVATLIGTPPNAVLAGAAQEMLGVRIGFGQWMLVGVPVAAVMLPLAWLLLVGVLHPPGEVSGDAEALLESEKAALGPASRAERTVGVVFLCTALAWIFRDPKQLGSVTVPGIATFAPQVTDATIAIVAALVLFVTPIHWKRGDFALDWGTARKIPWDVLVLFGGGLSLARAMERSGLATWIGGSVAELAGVPAWVVALAVASLFVFLTEVTSNTATATMAMPVMAGAAVGIGTDPLILMGTAALSASMAFMLPVATPPNAIVFGSGFLTIPQMGRAGFLLNLLAITIVTMASTLLIPALLVR